MSVRMGLPWSMADSYVVTGLGREDSWEYELVLQSTLVGKLRPLFLLAVSAMFGWAALDWITSLP